MSRPAPAALAVLGGFLFAACGGGNSPPADATVASSSAAGADNLGKRSLLLEVPEPQKAQLEDSAWDQIEAQRGQLDALEGDPTTSEVVLGEAYGSLGMLYNAYGFDVEAEACYLNAEILLPGDPRWIYYLAHLYRGRGDFPQALSRLEGLLETHSRDLPTLVWLGQTYLEQERFEDAAGAVRRALEVEPLNAPAFYIEGQVAAQGEDYEAAAEAFARALEIEPAASVMRYPYATALQRLGRRDEARQQLKLRGQRHPGLRDPLMEELSGIITGARIHLSRGSQAMRAGKREQAIAEFRAAAAADPESPRASLNLGAALAQAGRTEEAIAQLESTLQLTLSATNRSKTHFNLGALYLMVGKGEEAREHNREALRWDPENEAASRRSAALESPR